MWRSGRSLILVLVVWSCAVGALSAAGDARLVDAARARDLRATRALVGVVDINAAGANGATALQWAAHWEDMKIAEVLLEAGADPNRANTYGVTPLWLACENGSARMAKALLKAGADPQARLRTGESVLMTAVRTGNVDIVALLISAGADVNVAEDYRGQTALMWAVAEERLSIARTLLVAGADVHARTKPQSVARPLASLGGSTPLIFAARGGNVPLVELLVSHSARINDQPADDGSTPLLVATVRGHVELAEWLLEHGADPNVADAGYTPLHWAVGVWDSLLTYDYELGEGEWGNLKGIPTESQRMRLARALLAHGADPNARVTAQIPRFGGGSTGAESLRAIEQGATPYLIAAMSGEATLMRLLVEGGADPGARGQAPKFMPFGGPGVTALIAAAGQGHTPSITTVPESRFLEAAQVAIEHGADVNETNDRGFSALHAAAYAGFGSIGAFLVEQGADVNMADGRGRTPLDVAERDIYLGAPFSNPSITELLTEFGAARGTCVTAPDTDPVSYCSSEW